MSDLWQALKSGARDQLAQRDYSQTSLAQRLATTGVEAGELLGKRSDLAEAWIPGVEVFGRKIYRTASSRFLWRVCANGGGHAWGDRPVAAPVGDARMFANTAKGFHIHPPHIPADTTAEAWFQRLFVREPSNFQLRPYAHEQWDAMFFVAGMWR
jgi:hypothetical protein